MGTPSAPVVEATPAVETKATTPAVAPEPLEIKAPNPVVQAVETGFKATVKDLWKNYGIFFIIMGAILLVAKYRDLAIDILGLKSKEDVVEAQKTDQKLQAEENAANQQADALVKESNDLTKNEGEVSDDWDKKK
jgi:hypothetical protein